MRLMALDRSVVVAILALCPISVGQAQSPADFYKGKNIDLYIGYSAGGGYDVYARSLARHMGRFIPGNPTIVPKNMPGAGNLGGTRAPCWRHHFAKSVTMRSQSAANSRVLLRIS